MLWTTREYCYKIGFRTINAVRAGASDVRGILQTRIATLVLLPRCGDWLAGKRQPYARTTCLYPSGSGLRPRCKWRPNNYVDREVDRQMAPHACGMPCRFPPASQAGALAGRDAQLWSFALFLLVTTRRPILPQPLHFFLCTLYNTRW